MTARAGRRLTRTPPPLRLPRAPRQPRPSTCGTRATSRRHAVRAVVGRLRALAPGPAQRRSQVDLKVRRTGRGEVSGNRVRAGLRSTCGTQARVRVSGVQEHRRAVVRAVPLPSPSRRRQRRTRTCPSRYRRHRSPHTCHGRCKPARTAPHRHCGTLSRRSRPRTCTTHVWLHLAMTAPCTRHGCCTWCPRLA